MMKENLYIIGGGAIGLSLCALFCKENKLKIIVRDDRTFELPVKVTGSIECELNTDNLEVIKESKVNFSSDSIIFHATKSYSLESSLKTIRRSLNTDSSLIFFQNGLNIISNAKKLIDIPVRFIRCLAYYGAQKTTPRDLCVIGTPKFSVAGEQEIQANRISSLFQEHGAIVTTEPDIRTAEWKKVVTTLTVNTICSIFDAPNSALYENAEARAIIPLALKEIVLVARAEGVNLPDISVERFLGSIKRFGDNINSSLIDIRKGSKTELETLLPEFIKIAKSHSIVCPTMEEINQRLLNTRKL